MELNLKNKIIIVTGGSKGIGGGITRLLAKEGAIPIIIGRDELSIKSIVNELENKKQNVDYVYAELTNSDQCKKAIAFI